MKSMIILFLCLVTPLMSLPTKLQTTPMLTPEAISFLDQYLQEHVDARVLEFGSGGSTVWLSQRTKSLISFEHNPHFVNLVIKTLNSVNPGHKATLIYHELPYYDLCSLFQDETFDLVLVDGRHRVRCVLGSKNLVKPGGVLMLDDSQRHYYQEAFNVLKEWELHTSTSKERDTTWWIKPSI